MRYGLVAGDRLVTATAPMSEFRVGIDLGDMAVEGDEKFGDGVNNAARCEEMTDDAFFHHTCDTTGNGLIFQYGQEIRCNERIIISSVEIGPVRVKL